MSQTNEPEQEASLPLAPIARARPRLLRGLAWATVIAVIGLMFLVYRTRKQDCRSAARTETDAIAVLVCEREYLRTGDPATGARLAEAHRHSKNFVAASAIANGLLVTSARGEAFRVLGKIAFSEHRLDAAMSALETARDLHRAAARRGELALDDQAIAGIQQARNQFAQALRTLDECITEARAADEPVTEGRCHVSAAYVLVTVGAFDEAQLELDHARSQLTMDRDAVLVDAEQGNIYQEHLRSPVNDGYHDQAVTLFKHALARAQRAQLPVQVLSAELNLAVSLAELHRFEDAEQHLAEATLLDTDNAHANDRAQIAARIAYRRGNLALAASLNDRLYNTITDDNDRIEVCAMQAHIALASDDLVRAESWARRGIAQAEKMRAAESSVELRSWILATRREPYELLFAALARAGRDEQALEVFHQWQGRALHDALSRPAGAAALDLRGVASRIESLGLWLPMISAAPLMQSDAGHLDIKAVRSIDLLALVIADRHLWRVTTAGGQVHLDDLGEFAALKDRIERFTAAPTERALAEDVGLLLTRETTFRATHEPLRVVLDGPLSALPVAALRRNGQPLIAARPIVRAPRVSESACAARPSQPGKPVILADAVGNLPDARVEAQELASLLDTTSSVGAEATSAALFAAGRSNLLHVAVHADIDASGGYLALHDQNVHALDISAHKLGPALVVLAACGSAMSDDPDLSGSLATAFLAGGSAQVLATLRPVSDRGARELISQFYRQGGANDPVHVLAKIQASLDDTDNHDWPNFALFGHDLCNDSSTL
jgi:tetratricopeptide (TPR) repeat protein